MGAAQWAVWQLVNPLLPNVIEALTNLEIDVYGEVILMLWSFISLTALLFVNPFRGILSKIESIVLEFLNLVLCFVPVANRYFFTVPETGVEILGLIGIGIPLLLVIVLPIIEWLKDDSPKGSADQCELYHPLVDRRDVLMSFFAERSATRTQKLCIAACEGFSPGSSIDDIPLSHLLVGLTDVSTADECPPAIEGIREATFPKEDGLFGEGTPLARAFPEFPDRLRVIRAGLTEDQIKVLQDFILSPDSVPPEYRDSLPELWGQIAGDPSLFVSVLTMSTEQINRLKYLLQHEQVNDFSIHEQFELACLPDSVFTRFGDAVLRCRELCWPLGDHDLFRVCLKWAQDRGRDRVPKSIDAVYELVTTHHFDHTDVDAVLCLATIRRDTFGLLLLDPDFSDEYLAIDCLLDLLIPNYLSSKFHPGERELLDLIGPKITAFPRNLTVQLYYFARQYSKDHDWVTDLLRNVPDASDVEKRCKRRLTLRMQAPSADIDFQSGFLLFFTAGQANGLWWFMSWLTAIPIGWFLGARAGILNAMLEAHCG
jgi:hypothetical protein